MTSLRTQMRYLNPYEIHKLLVNEYFLQHPGDTKLLNTDKSQGRTDFHVIKENHRFLWNDDVPHTWEEQFAKRYYEKLFKEYCIADLSRYKENRVALRWRVEREVISGKGQFVCGNKHCQDESHLRSWEVNFAYEERGERKNALVKIRLCPSCSKKLNYHSRKREVTRLKRKSDFRYKQDSIVKSDTKKTNEEEEKSNIASTSNVTTLQSDLITTRDSEETPWEDHKPVETKSQEEEMDEYLQDLLI